jgi:hypothetical protein
MPNMYSYPSNNNNNNNNNNKNNIIFFHPSADNNCLLSLSSPPLSEVEYFISCEHNLGMDINNNLEYHINICFVIRIIIIIITRENKIAPKHIEAILI